MAVTRRMNRFINTKTSTQWNKQRKHPCKFKTQIKNPTRTSRNNSPIIIAKGKNMNKSTFIEEANQIFQELSSNIKQEICPTSGLQF